MLVSSFCSWAKWQCNCKWQDLWFHFSSDWYCTFTKEKYVRRKMDRNYSRMLSGGKLLEESNTRLELCHPWNTIDLTVHKTYCAFKINLRYMYWTLTIEYPPWSRSRRPAVMYLSFMTCILYVALSFLSPDTVLLISPYCRHIFLSFHTIFHLQAKDTSPLHMPELIKVCSKSLLNLSRYAVNLYFFYHWRYRWLYL